MKLSDVAFILGASLGIPAYFMKVGALPVAAQIGWVSAIVVCGIAGCGLSAFEHAAHNGDH